MLFIPFFKTIITLSLHLSVHYANSSYKVHLFYAKVYIIRILNTDIHLLKPFVRSKRLKSTVSHPRGPFHPLCRRFHTPGEPFHRLCRQLLTLCWNSTRHVGKFHSFSYIITFTPVEFHQFHYKLGFPAPTSGSSCGAAKNSLIGCNLDRYCQ